MKITGFRGVLPRTSPRLIDDAAAETAENIVLTSGEARPLAQPLAIYDPTKVGVKNTIYKADDNYWFTWTQDVDVARSPLPGTVKWAYTGENEPRMTTLALAITGTGDNYPAACRVLGVPNPVTSPTVSPSGGTLVDVSRYYVYTFYDDWNQESGISPLSTLTTGKPDGTWAISGMDIAPANTGDITAITYVGTAVTITTTNAHFNRVGEMVTLAGVTTVTNVNGTWKLTAANFAAKTMTFSVTTAPTGVYNNATDTTDSWTRVASHGTCTKRLYRTSGTTAQFQLVAEGITLTTYSDTLSDSLIPGDELISTDWAMPPVDLTSLINLPSGAMCGLSGNEVCFSEPFQPHAWPANYRLSTKYPGVAVGLFTSGVVVGTTGTPEVLLGHEPGQMTGQPVSGAYPCLSKRSMVSLGDRVAYATAHGLATIGDTGVDLLTKDTYTRDEWDTLTPASMVAASVRGRLYLMTYGAGDQLLIFDYLDGTGLTTSDVSANELYADDVTGKLYISDVTNQDVREFDPVDGIYMSMTWKSKEFVIPEPINLGAARINFASRLSAAQSAALLAAQAAIVSSNSALLTAGDIGGELNGNELNALAVNESELQPVPSVEAALVTFTLFSKGVAVYSTTVDHSNPFRLPSGYKSDTYSFEVKGQVLVKSIDAAETMLGMKGA